MPRFGIESKHSDCSCVSPGCHSWHAYSKIGRFLVMYTKTRSSYLRPALDNIIMMYSFIAALEYTVSICFRHFWSSVTWMPNNFDWSTLSISSPSMVHNQWWENWVLTKTYHKLFGVWGIHFHIVFLGPFWNIISYCLHVTDWTQHPFLELSFSSLRISDAVESSIYLTIGMSTSRSFIWVMKRRDPSLVPCWTPPLRVTHFEVTWPTVILCFLSARKAWTQYNSTNGTP